MAEKRKDKKGRVLKDGESQRSDGSYQFRYYDIHHKRRYVYAKTLDALRRKEEDVRRDLDDGIDYSAGEVTVSELVDRYMNMKRKIKTNSSRAYSSAVSRIKASKFGQKQIRSVKTSDAKAWFVELHDDGLKQNTITVLHSVLRPAFEMAVEDDILRKNPFKFKLSDLIPDDSQERIPLTKEQQEKYLTFIKDYGNDNYYDDIVILLGTGLRVSELYGLTKTDVDLKNRCLYVRRQLCRTAERPYFVTTPKTNSGVRRVPMSEPVYQAFLHAIQARPHPRIEMIIDGCSGFIFLDKDEKPKVAMHLQNYMRCMQKKFEKLYGSCIPHVTPHVLRHAFCTNLQQAGIDVKSLQYLMGHSNVSVTLDVYTHTDSDFAEQAFREVMSC